MKKNIFLVLFVLCFDSVSIALQSYPKDWRVLTTPSSCQCFALFESKKYIPEMEVKHWYGGITRGWTCEYICIAPDGREEKVLGTQKGGFTFSETGDEFSCFGSQYVAVQTPMRTDRWYILDLEGVKSFTASKSKIQELVSWSQSRRCQ